MIVRIGQLPMAIATKLLTIGPTVKLQGSVVTMRTSVLGALLTLGLWVRFVTIDGAARTVRVHNQLLWLIPWRVEIPFSDIAEVVYTYSDLLDIFPMMRASDAIDCYTISLERRDLSIVTLFSWVGEGEFVNETYWPDFVYWLDFRIDFTGTQKKESMHVFELLRQAVKEAAPSPLQGQDPDRYRAGRARR